jgi:hypothetical protein
MVYGLVTAQIPDQDGEVMDYDSTAPFYKALNERFSKATDGKSIGPLREMHQLSAVGVGKSIEFDDKAKTIHMAFKVVDDVAWNKVVERVYTGFSQGGSYVKTWRDNGVLYYTADPTEVSLVDNPCLSEATYDYVKADGTTELCKITPTAPPAADVLTIDFAKLKSQAKGKLAKGMYTVQDMARLIESLKWMQTDVLYERDYEGDDSPMPEKLAQLLRDAVACFMEMADEESKELLAGLEKGVKNMTPEEIKALEAKVKKSADTLAKAKASMKSLHDHLGKGMEMCKALMGDEDEGDAKKVVEKTATELAAEKLAADAAAEELRKAAELAKGSKQYTQAEIDELVKTAATKAVAEAEAAKAKLTLVPRPGEQITKAAETSNPSDLKASSF